MPLGSLPCLCPCIGLRTVFLSAFFSLRVLAKIQLFSAWLCNSKEPNRGLGACRRFEIASLWGCQRRAFTLSLTTHEFFWDTARPQHCVPTSTSPLTVCFNGVGKPQNLLEPVEPAMPQANFPRSSSSEAILSCAATQFPAIAAQPRSNLLSTVSGTHS